MVETQNDPKALTPNFVDALLRAFRIGSSTTAIVEALRNEWTNSGLATLAWVTFLLVERRRIFKSPSNDPSEHG